MLTMERPAPRLHDGVAPSDTNDLEGEGPAMEKIQEFAVKAQNSLYSIKEAARDERGAAGVEYGLLVALIAAVIIAIVVTLGGQVKQAFTDVSSKM
jgi:pilus assembly protein Flp/PilA